MNIGMSGKWSRGSTRWRDRTTGWRLWPRSFDAEEVAASAFEQPDGHGRLRYFKHHPTEKAVHRVRCWHGVAETSLTDWVRKSLEGLTPVEVDASSCMARITAPACGRNRQLHSNEPALAFGRSSRHHARTPARSTALAETRPLRRRPRLRVEGCASSGAVHIRRTRALASCGKNAALACVASDVDPRRRAGEHAHQPGRRIRGDHGGGSRGAAAFRSARQACSSPEPSSSSSRTSISRSLRAGGHRRALRNRHGASWPRACVLARGLVLVRRIRLEGW